MFRIVDGDGKRIGADSSSRLIFLSKMLETSPF